MRRAGGVSPLILHHIGDCMKNQGACAPAHRRGYFGSDARLAAINLSKLCCGSANLLKPSCISVSSRCCMLHLGVDFVQHGLRRQFIHLPREMTTALLHGVVGGRRIGFDVGAGEGLDVLLRRVFRLLRAGAGEDHFLLDRQVLVGPKLLVELPDVLGVDDADLPLSGRRQLRDVLLGVYIQPADENAVDRFEPVQRRTALRLRQMASRAALYCRSEKMSVTLSVMPAAAISSRAPRPAGVAGTLIMRLL